MDTILDERVKRFNLKRSVKYRTFNKGDFVKIKEITGKFSEPKMVLSETYGSVQLQDGSWWPKRRASRYQWNQK